MITTFLNETTDIIRKIVRQSWSRRLFKSIE